MSRAAWLAVVFGAGLVASCFNPPSDDVLFACNPADEPACPSGYTCEEDGCCHRDGSNVKDNLGACALGVEAGESGTTEDETGTDTDGTDTDGTDTGTDGGAEHTPPLR